MKSGLIYRLFQAGGLFVLGTALSVRPAWADAKYDLKHDEKVGHRFEFMSISDMTQNFVVTPEGGKADRDEQHKVGRRKGTIEVIEIRKGAPSALKIHFDEDGSTDSIEQNTNKKSVSFALAGKTVVVRIDEKGKVTSDAPENTDPDAINEISEEILPSRAMLPPHPVAMGEEWQPDTSDLAKQYQLGPKDKIEAKCKFETVDAAGRFMTAHIHFTGHVTKDANGIPSHLEVEGVKQIDLISGEILRSDVTGKMTMEGKTNGPGPDGKPTTAAINGSITFHEIEDRTPVTGPDGIPLIGPAAAPPAAPMNNDIRAYTGVFKSDQLTVELAVSDNGQLRGIISMGEKKFPASATLKDGKLTGVFETEGMKFEFTATLDGKTMTLTSDKTDYVLKKRVNPLDRGAQPAPKNPLAQ